MKRLTATAVLTVLTTASASHASLVGRVDLVESNLATVLTNPFGAPGPAIDVYHVVVVNSEASDATSLELDLRGPFLNNFTFSQLDFQDNTDLPAPAGTPVADSFFVTPPGTVGIGRDDIDDENGILSAAFTIQGGAVFIPAGDEAVVAVLSVPTGTGMPFDPCSSGFAAIGGELAYIFFGCPEPSTALLTGLALAGVAAGRR